MRHQRVGDSLTVGARDTGQLLAKLESATRNTWIIDHHQWVSDHPEVLTDDGIHLTNDGYGQYADRIVGFLFG